MNEEVARRIIADLEQYAAEWAKTGERAAADQTDPENPGVARRCAARVEATKHAVRVVQLHAGLLSELVDDLTTEE